MSAELYAAYFVVLVLWLLSFLKLDSVEKKIEALLKKLEVEKSE